MSCREEAEKLVEAMTITILQLARPGVSKKDRLAHHEALVQALMLWKGDSDD